MTFSCNVNETFPVRMVNTSQGRIPVPINIPNALDGSGYLLVEEERIEYGEPSEKDNRIISDALEHLKAARGFEYPVGDDVKGTISSRWSNWKESLFEDAQTLKTCREVLHFAQSRVPFDHRNEALETEDFKVHLNLLRNEFESRMEEFVSIGENPNSLPKTLKTSYGILLSNAYFWHCRMLLVCKAFVPKVKTVLEIGGGYGGLARLWLHDNKVSRYTIVDLPEVLFFAEVALRDEFGDRVGYWDGKDPGTQLVLVPITRLKEHKASHELIINAGSMQEMSDSWIDFYMKYLDHCGARFFYSLNYMAQPIDAMAESRSFWAPRPSREWAARVINADPTLVKMMCPNRNFCDVLYEKTPSRRKLADWSVLDGAFVTRANYLEGLDLLRHDWTLSSMELFMDTLLQETNKRPLPIYKEMFFVVTMIKVAGSDKFDRLKDYMVSHLANFNI